MGKPTAERKDMRAKDLRITIVDGCGREKKLDRKVNRISDTCNSGLVLNSVVCCRVSEEKS